MLLKKEDSLLLLIDVQEKLTPKIDNSAAMVARCEWLLKLAKRMEVPLLVSEQYPQGLGATLVPLSSYFEAQNCIVKTHFSCMQESFYEDKLRASSKKQFVVIGIEAHVCVLQTVLEMKAVGFEVFVVVDAIGSRNELDKFYAIERMRQAGIYLLTSEMVFFEWVKKSATPEFKLLSKEFLQ